MLTAGILGYSIGIWFDLYSMLQLVHLFPVARLYLPTSLFKFFKALEYLNFQGLNYGFWDFEDIIIEGDLVKNGDTTNYNFEKMGFSTSSFFYTAQDAVMVIIYLSFFPIVVRTLALIFTKSNFVKNFEKKVLWPFLPFIIYITLLILTFTAVLNFKDYNADSGSEAVNTLAAFGYFLFLAIFMVFLTIITILYWRELKKSGTKAFTGITEPNDDKVRKGSIKGFMFFLNYRTSNPMYYWYPMIFILRRIAVTFVLTYWAFDGFDQLLLLSFISLFMLVWYTSYCPFRSKLRNI
jgi:cbb3-type cytochrome oxidase subunit 3